MASFVTEFKHLEIRLEDIKSATNNFDETKVIGRGGFGKVYIGELSHSQSGEKSLVAIKRLDRKHGQGDPEFFKEIRLLSCYKHENLIALLGFCCQGSEMILIYEYASGGSLDRLLSSPALTWMQRLRICLDAAKGLSFLHDPNGTQQRVLHCDIKSANILLDKNMTTKVSDFGLSKMGPANQQYSVLITSPVGTTGYCDPLYYQTYSLTKESDVYSFGVVLFEVMSGRLCVENRNGRMNVIVPFWRKSYEDNKLDEIILQDLKQQMDLSSMKTFSDIAYQCLRYAREERPTMSRVVEQLEIAVESQEFPDLRLEVLSKYEDILMAVDPLLIYKTGKQLKERLSITEKGEHIIWIGIEDCLSPDEIYPSSLKHDIFDSRFPGGLCYSYYCNKFKARVRGEYLTPQVSYTVNLVFRFEHECHVNSYNPLRNKRDGEAKVFIIYPRNMREDGRFVVPLYHFTSQGTTVDLQFEFELPWSSLEVAGIKFQPSEEKVKLPVFEEYQYIIEVASQSLVYGSLQELKQILSTGIHLNGYKTWFSLNLKGQHCHMISMEGCLNPNENSPSQYESHNHSRFPAGMYVTEQKGFRTHVKTQLLTPSITYTINLVCQRMYVDLKYKLKGEKTTSTVYLSNWRNEDDLCMAELFQFYNDGSIVDLEIDFEDHGTNLTVEGIMFQPLEIVEYKVSTEDKVENIQTISDTESDAYWEHKLPNDYEEILNLSIANLMWTTKKELYSILRRGFLIDNGQQWFVVDNHGKKYVMLSAKATCVIDDKNSACKSPNETRFGGQLVIAASDKFKLVSEIKPTTLSLDTSYACYLVYSLPQDQSSFESPLKVSNCPYGYSYYHYTYSYLVSPSNTPIIGQKLEENSYNPQNRHKQSTHPRQRNDGWMEVQVWNFQTFSTPRTVSINLKVEHPVKKDLCGLIIQAIEIRPVKIFYFE